jgi:hypothetical protein
MGGGRVAPRLARHEPKKTSERIARARTRGQNPLVHTESYSDFEVVAGIM